MHVTTHSTNLSFTVPVSTNPNATNKLTNRQNEQTQSQQHQGQQTQQHDEDSEMADCDTEEEVLVFYFIVLNVLNVTSVSVIRYQPQLSVVSAQSITNKRHIKYLSYLDRTVKMVQQYNIFKQHRLSYPHHNIRQQHIFKVRHRRRVIH